MKRLLILAFLIPTLSALPAVSGATDGLSGNVTAGAGAVKIDKESYKYGEYSGLRNNRLFFVGDADLSYNRGAYYLDFRAKDVGLDNRSLYLDSGKLRSYDFFLGFDQIPHLISNNSKTPLDGAGGANLTLPAGFVQGATTPAMTNLSNNIKDVRLEIKRSNLEAGFSKTFGSDIDFNISFEQQKEEGTKSLGGTLGLNGGNTRSIVLPEPVDYTNNVLRTSIAYTGEKAQARFEYYLSDFSNANNSVTWDNPFNVANYPTTARTSLPPDNKAQRFTLSGALSLPYYTRVSAVAEYGIMRQDEALLPYSNNPLSVITTPLPRDTADAEIDVTHLTVNVSTKPFARLGLNVKYRYYSTDNTTPRTLFLYVKNDTGGAQTVVTDSNALYTLPFDYTQNQLKFDASYYLFRGTTLKAGYDYDGVKRGFREIGKTREDTYRAALRSQYLSYASMGLNYSYSDKRGVDSYDQSSLFNVYHTQEHIDMLAADARFDNNPLLRKFDIADRKRTKYGANATLFPTDKATVGLYYNYSKDDYGNSELGLRYRKNRSYTADLTFSPADYASVYAFYTKEVIETLQNSRAFINVVQSADPTRNWSADLNNNVDTVGVGASMGFMENRLTVNADYSYSESTGKLKFWAGSSLPVPVSMPDLGTRLHTLNVTGKYRLTRNISVGAGYNYERYDAANWQTDGVDPASTVLANVLTLSGSNPDYDAHRGMVFMTYYFGKTGRL